MIVLLNVRGDSSFYLSNTSIYGSGLWQIFYDFFFAIAPIFFFGISQNSKFNQSLPSLEPKKV